MNVQPINLTNQTFRGTITVKNFKTGATTKFLTNEQTDLDLFKYFQKSMRAIFFNFNTKEHMDALSKIVKQDLGKGLEHPQADDFIGEFAAKVVKKDGKKEGLNVISSDGFFSFEHNAPYVDVNSWV